MTANGRGCSATLLTNSWAISAAHCLDAAAMRMPANVQLNGNWGAKAQIGNADYIYRSWGLDDRGFMYDFSLIHLQSPMRVNGTTTGYVRELSELSLNDMNNVNVAVYGRGINVLASRAEMSSCRPPATTSFAASCSPSTASSPTSSGIRRTEGRDGRWRRQRRPEF